MKHQISKVVVIATLAFIGAGFAGTQQAKATSCTPDYCSGDSCTYTTVYRWDGPYQSPCPDPPNRDCLRATPGEERYLVGTDCRDCFGSCVRTMVDKWVRDTTCNYISTGGATCPPSHCYKKYTMGTAGTCPTRPNGDTNAKGPWY